MSSPFHLLTPGLRLVLTYYLASPLFWILQVIFGWQVRVGFLADSKWNTLYYCLLILCAVAGYLRPGWLAFIAVIESAVNIGIHIVSFAMPLFTLSDSVLQGQVTKPDLSVANLIGFLLAGLCMSLSFQTAIARLHRKI